MLFSLIFKMREEIEQLRADVDELKGEKPSQPASSLVKLRPAIIDTPVEIMDAKAEEMPPHDAGLAAATQAGLPRRRSSGCRSSGIPDGERPPPWNSTYPNAPFTAR